MTDIAMHMMDIAQNSIRANAKHIDISFIENQISNELVFCICDDGDGMASEMIAKITSPFFTTRTTRKVGLGVPFLKMTAEQTEGSFFIESELGKGTKVKAKYMTNHIDCLPLGDIPGYLILLFIANPKLQILFEYEIDGKKFSVSTTKLAAEGVTDLNNAEISAAIRTYVKENLDELASIRNANSFLC
ncbi:MAG: ATP-binding protein [Bacteroidota bacterium]|nr:ATP-binding protein [Bacteroidota bacterium]